MNDHLFVEIDPRLRPFRVRANDVSKLTDPAWAFQTVLWAALIECDCQARRCKNITAGEDKDDGALTFTHGEGLRTWPRERDDQDLVVDLIEWFREIHAYQASLG